MIKTLIIDDNKIMREYFQSMIDWESKGFTLAAVANNGITGWQEFSKHKPDLVITDIQMPGLSGLELSRKIKEASPDTIIVFISNYDNFNYAKSALEIGVFDYILKHETRGACFDQKLERIRQEFLSRSSRMQDYYESQLYIALSSNSNTVSRLEQILPGEYALLMLESAGIFPSFIEHFGCNIPELPDDFLDSLTESSSWIICRVQTGFSQYVLLLKPDCDLNHFAKELCQQLYLADKLHMYAVPVCERGDIATCLSLFHRYRHCMDRKYFKKYDRLILPSDPIPGPEPSVDQQLILSVLEQADFIKMCELLDSLAYTVCSRYSYQLLIKIADILLGFLTRKYNELSDKALTLYDEDDLTFWTNADEIFSWFKLKLKQLFECLRQNPVYACSEPIKQAIDYINRNYSNCNLNVGEIADYVGLNINQLNRLMKKETGQTVIKWLTDIRIEKAKQLLMKNKKLTEIYSDVGYANLSYFANVFKKTCKETPLEYRRRTLETKKSV